MEDPITYLSWFIVSYLLGSLSFGDLVSRWSGVDIRSVGTGNPGAANIYREVGHTQGIAVFLLDVGKGVVVTLPINFGFPIWLGVLGMAGAIGGHVLPAPWRSSVGTGMALAMGTTLGLLPFGALTATIPTIVVMKLSKNPAYTGVLFFVTAAVVGWLFHHELVAVIAVVTSAISILIKSLVQYKDG